MNHATPEYQSAVLIIKREVGDFNCAGATVDGRRQPVHRPIAIDQHVSVVSNVKLAINAEQKKD